MNFIHEKHIHSSEDYSQFSIVYNYYETEQPGDAALNMFY